MGPTCWAKDQQWHSLIRCCCFLSCLCCIIILIGLLYQIRSKLADGKLQALVATVESIIDYYLESNRKQDIRDKMTPSCF